jgi:tRNA-splicing ligase RtcB (3'-phosphate/5'-hydroxy nucleic acid ligase)
MERAMREATGGIDVRWYLGKPDFAESPLGYKPAGKVRDQIHEFGLAQVVGGIAPLGSVMAGRPRWGDEEELTPKQERQIQHRSERRRQRRELRREVWSDQDP